jgi:hypothetical protein
MPKKSKKRNTIYRKRNTRKNYKRKSLRFKRKRQKGGVPDQYKCTDLYLSFRNNDVDGAIKLLKENNELAFCMYKGIFKTSLHYAVESGNMAVIVPVLDSMNDHLTEKVKSLEFTEEFANKCRTNYMNMIPTGGRSPLYTCITKIREPRIIIKTLRNNGADVNNLFEENHHLFLPPTPQGIIAKLLEPLPDAINLNEEKIIILKRLHLHNKANVDIHSTNIDDEAY